MNPKSSPQKKAKHDQADLDFLMNTKLLKALTSETIDPLLDRLVPKELKKGERFITQGEEGESLFIIEQGLCSINVETDGSLHTIAQRRKGDVVGEMALLTGEPRNAHIDAESRMRLWELSRDDFDNVSFEHPDLREFLTELLTNRLENSPVIAVRNVGRYTINNLLGQGGWSLVYRGRHRGLDRTVAIKMLKHNLAMNEDFLERFRNEAQVIARMNHPNVVGVFDILELYRTVFIVMEFLEGESLKSLLERKGALPFNRAVNFLLQICSGLAYAHQQGVVHLDVKPANIFIMPNDQVKIVDFGLACAPGDEDMWLKGTPKYMSPEQIEGDPVDERTDIYSLGITTYEMFTGQRPYPEDDVNKLLAMHLSEDVPDPRDLVPDLPEPLRRFILRACRRPPEERYPNMREVLGEIESLTQVVGVEDERPTLPRRKTTLLLLSVDEARQQALDRLLDEFSAEAEKLGIKVRAVEIKDL